MGALGGKEPKIKTFGALSSAPKSKIGRLLEDKLMLETYDLQKVLGTYCKAAAYNLSKTKVYNKNSFVNMDGLATEGTYHSI
jgi:hypothetical protein